MWADEEVFSLNDSSPDSLFDICMSYIVNNLDIITTQDPSTRWRMLRSNIALPAEICDNFLEAYQKKHRVNDNVANIFRDRARTRLTIVKLRNARITDRGLRCLLAHKPKQVELLQCEYVSQAAIDIISENNENLVSLNFGPLTFTPNPLFATDNFYKKRRPEARNLRRLTMQCRSMLIMPLMLLKPLDNLTHLDISDYSSAGVYSLADLKKLVSLVLHNVVWSKEITDWICYQKNLRHLDISHDNDRHGKYYNASEILHKLVSNLPNLESLDISGTNLAGSGAGTMTVVKDGPNAREVVLRCDIPGLITRVGRPLEFLGLYGTLHGACKRHDIPAKIISGDANEEQILTAAKVYFNRPAMLTRVLNDLYYLFRYENITHIGRALNVVLQAMEQYVSEKHIQISGSATLFYIVKGKEKPHIGLRLKRRIITVLLNGMEAHIGDDTMMRNGCLTLCQFKIPVDVLYEYERVVQILLDVSEVSQQWFVQRIAIYLLNSLACQVDGKQKRFLGDKGAISKMLQVIAERLERRVCDDVMEVAWSTMWNVTDETPQNCQRFLENRGMDYFQACLKSFPDNDELLRNMMGLLGNVAEVPYLRPQLMHEVSLTVFYDLLNSDSDGIEVSYNAAGVLAHIASDGPAAWTVRVPSREAVLERVAAAVQRWDRRAERNINYRSFQPILTLLHAHHTPQCQHWAAWALANLTTVYPEKYCNLVESEGGLKLLHDLLIYPGPYATIKELALIVIGNCTRYSSRDNPPAADNPDN